MDETPALIWPSADGKLRLGCIRSPEGQRKVSALRRSAMITSAVVGLQRQSCGVVLTSKLQHGSRCKCLSGWTLEPDSLFQFRYEPGAA